MICDGLEFRVVCARRLRSYGKYARGEDESNEHVQENSLLLLHCSRHSLSLPMCMSIFGIPNLPLNWTSFSKSIVPTMLMTASDLGSAAMTAIPSIWLPVIII